MDLLSSLFLVALVVYTAWLVKAVVAITLVSRIDYLDNSAASYNRRYWESARQRIAEVLG